MLSRAGVVTDQHALPEVMVPSIDPEEYTGPAGRGAVRRLRAAAERFEGRRIVNLNATAFGGGVAELLRTQTGLLRGLGVEAEWRLIRGGPEFFAVTKQMHNALQGAELSWTPEMEAVYLSTLQADALALRETSADVFVIHDPQPCALRAMVADDHPSTWVWRCHIDTSHPHDGVWGFLAPYMAQYDSLIFSLPEYAGPEREGPPVRIVPPSIDPLSVKNAQMSTATVEAVLRDLGIDRNRPIVAQVSRFDPWKDPLGVIDAFRQVRRHHPDAQLVLAGSLAHDDPEGLSYLELARDHAGDDPDIHIFTELDGVGPLEVNALQRGATVVVQKSLREGFGLVVTEAMWKRQAVVGASVGGIAAQIEDGVSGLLCGSVDSCAEMVSALLMAPERRRAMGQAAYMSVRDRSLVVHELASLLDVMGSGLR